MSARAAEPPYSIAGEAREEFASGEAASEFNSTLYQPSHGFATSVHGFATKTNALACEIPPATQASAPFKSKSWNNLYGEPVCRLIFTDYFYILIACFHSYALFIILLLHELLVKLKEFQIQVENI